MPLLIIDPITHLRRLVRDLGSQQAAAAALGIGPSYLSDLLRGRRECSVAILKKLHLRRVVVRGPQ
ncbi:MAG: helix-turn-helix transcriptional regulator [Acidobacteria bacterium]|nr:helix-turn-helix transcriptional regulator [Acidobacteriota bacterium]